MLPYILSRGALWAKGRLESLLRKSYTVEEKSHAAAGYRAVSENPNSQ